jgi:hypothetical protein
MGGDPETMADLNEVRRRADEFARLVDGAAPSPNPVQDPEFADAMDLVEAMREAGAVEPRPEFSATLRQRLIDEAAGRITATPNEPDQPDDLPDRPDEDEDLALPTPLHAPRYRRGKLIASAAAFVVLAGGIGAAAAAQQAMPGDALYGLKRGLESVATSISFTDDSRGRRELSHALARLTEAEKLAARNAPAGTISDTLHDFSTEARSGADHLVASYHSDNDVAAIEKIYVFAEEARTRLLDLSKTTAPAVQPAIADAMRTIVAIVQQGMQACPACVAPKVMTTPPPSVATSQSPGPTRTAPTKPSGLATPGIPAIQTPRHPTGPVPSGGATLLPSVPLPTGGLPSLPLTKSPPLPLPTASLPTLPLPTVSLPTVSLPTLGLPPPTLVPPPLMLSE